MNRTEFIGLDLYYSQEFVDDKNKEIEKLQAEIKLLEDNRNYLNDRIDKAIEYIESLENSEEINVYQEDKSWVYVLEILKGENNE